MKNIILKSALLVSLTTGLFFGCANDDHYTTPNNALVTYDLTTTRTVQSVNADAVAANNTNPGVPIAFPTTTDPDQIIEAYVTSSDEKGTFYKSISFQTLGANPIGFSVPLNVTTLYSEGFIPGRKVYIKLNGLYSAIVYGSLQIGSLYNGTIGRISEFEWKNHLFPSATVEPESALVRTLSLSDAYTDANQNTLVELNNVQFSDSSLGRTYYDIDSGGGATNHTISSTNGGTAQIIRFSSFCPFTFNQVPSASGKIRGVLTKYDTDFQFIVRYQSDIKLDQGRFDLTPALGGTAIQYLGAFSENFETYPASTSIFPKYINDALLGTRYWATESFSGNKYLKLSAFSSNSNYQEQNNKAYFVVPVNFTAANGISFKTQDRFNVGDVLKVYYSTDYVPGGNNANATLNNITFNFNISSGNTGSASQPFVNSGVYNFPTSLIGNGFIIFEYTGGYSFDPDLTTTIHIDDITVN
jgi:hypothetical protein